MGNVSKDIKIDSLIDIINQLIDEDEASISTLVSLGASGDKIRELEMRNEGMYFLRNRLLEKII